MGFDEAKVRAALDSAKGDLNQATDILLSSMWFTSRNKNKFGLDLATYSRIEVELGNRVGSIIIWFHNRSLDIMLMFFFKRANGCFLENVNFWVSILE